LRRAPSKASLKRQLGAYFPDRWEIERLESRIEGENMLGTIKIHCLQDDKVFLSDFAARLDDKGKIQRLTLDGVNVGKFVGRLHSSV
jgi:hypothetical protein